MTPHTSQEQQKQPPRVSVVVVSHNQVEPLRRCLEAIESSDERDRLQVIAVDNGSSDGSAQLDSEFPAVQWIRLPKNFGLTKAWNLGWRAADADYVLFLHADAEVEPSAILRLAKTLDPSPRARVEARGNLADAAMAEVVEIFGCRVSGVKR